MGRDGASLGSDENTAGRAVYLMLIITFLFIFTFSLANLTQAGRDLATFYLLFAIPPLIAIVVDMVMRKVGGKLELPDTITVEKESPIFGDIGRSGKALIVAGSLIVAGFLFLYIGGRSQLTLVSAPTFQAIEPGPFGNAVLSAIAGAGAEDVAFWGVMLPSMYVVFYRLLRPKFGRKFLAVLVSILLAASLFTVYHFARYSEQPQSLDQVFYFGLFCAGSTVATGMLVTCSAIHAANNFSVTFFRLTSADVFLWVVLYWFLIGLGTFAYLRRAGK